MNKTAYLLALYGGLLLGGVPFAVGYLLILAERRDELGLALSLVAFGALVLLVVPTVTCSLLVYRMWSALPRDHARTTPGKAVGLSFVPLFNLYWIFQVYPGFASDYNAYVARSVPGARPVTRGLFVTVAVLAIVSLVPVVGYLTGLASLVLMGVVISQVCDAVNDLRTLPLGGPGGERGIVGRVRPPPPLSEARVPTDALAGTGAAWLLVAAAIVAGDLTSQGIVHLQRLDSPPMHWLWTLFGTSVVRALLFVLVLMFARNRIVLVLAGSALFASVHFGQRWLLDLLGPYAYGGETLTWLDSGWVFRALAWPAIFLSAVLLAMRLAGATPLALIGAGSGGFAVADVVLQLSYGAPYAPSNTGWSVVYGAVQGAFLFLGFRLARGVGATPTTSTA